MLQARREPLTPRSTENLKANSAKVGDGENGKLNSSGYESVSKAPTASGDASQENNPQLAHPARSEAKQPREWKRSTEAEGPRTSVQMSEAESAAFSKRKADLARLQADLEVREYQMINQMEMSRNEIREYEEAAQRAKSNELLLQKDLDDMEIGMQADVSALKAAHVEAVQQLQRQHDAELDEVQLQSAEDIMQDMMTKVSRLQAAIAEAAAQVGITVSWCPPSFANSGLQEEFEEMGAWLSRISDTLHELCRERRRLMEAHREEAQRRREVQAELFDLQGPVQVLCRMHNGAADHSDDEGAGTKTCFAEPPTKQKTGCLTHDPATPDRVEVNSNRYNFQTVFPESEGLEEVFDELEPTVLSVLDGHNVCILSHELADVSSHATLLGSEVDSGLSARCAEALFEAAAADPSLTSARLHVSFVEVTESAVYDIMASNPQQRGGRQDQREPWIEIDPASDNIEVHQQEVEDPEDATDVLQACFSHRQKNSSGKLASKNSAQGHTLTCITVTTSNEGLETVSYLWVAGLSGSAVLAAQDGLEADVHNASGVNCNLSALATCLAVRCQGRADVPWSDSPLTCLLKGCLGPGSRLVLLANLSEAGPVSSSTAATLDWMQHLQTLTTARHMSAHTLTHDDSSSMAGGSTALLHPVTSVPHVATCDDLPPPVEAGNSTGRWSEARTDSSAVLPVPAALAGDHPSRSQALVAEVEQLKTRVHDLLGENARLRAEVSELSNKQTLVQADAASITDYKLNSALARHSLHAHCNDLQAHCKELQAQLTEAKSRRESCASPTSLSKHSSRDCGLPCDALGFALPGAAAPVAGSAPSGLASTMSGTAAASLQDGGSTVQAANVAACSNDSAVQADSGAAAQVCAVEGTTVTSEPTSEDLDASPSPDFAAVATDTSAGVRDSTYDGEAVALPSAQVSLKKLPELSRQITEDSLIKSSSFSLQPSSVATRCESDAAVVAHNISAVGTFHDNSAMLAHEVGSAYSKSVQPAWTTQTAATDSSRMDSDLLAVLSDCPSASVVNPACKGPDDAPAAAATHFTVPQALSDGQNLPEVFESLDLAQYIEAGKAPKPAPKPGVAVPLLTIPAPPPQLASHKSGAAPLSKHADSQNPAPPRVVDSVDLSLFIKGGTDTPRDGESTARSVNVMDSVDLNAFMKIESEAYAMTAAQGEGPMRVMDSVDLSAFIKGEASTDDAGKGNAAATSKAWQGTGPVRVMDSVELSNFIKSDEDGGPSASQQGGQRMDSCSLPGEDSYGRLQCIAEETETLDISAALMPEVTKEHEAPDHKSADQSSLPIDEPAQCEPSASDADPTGPPPASDASGGNSKAPENASEKPATVSATADAAQYEGNFKRLLGDNDAEDIVPACSGQADDQTISLAPAAFALNQPQVTPTLAASSSRGGAAPIDSVPTDRLLCDSSGEPGGREERPADAQQIDAVATDGHGWGGAERLDQDFVVGDVDGPPEPDSGSGSGSRASLRLSLGRAGEGLRGLFSSRKGERGDSKPLDRRWSSVTPRGVTPRGTTPRHVTPRGVTPRQGQAVDDATGGGLKTPRSVLGSRASIDKLMRSAFKRSTTLLASARRNGRRQRPDASECPIEGPAATAPILGDVHRSSSVDTGAHAGPGTPKKLDFSSSNAAAHSPDVDQSAQSLQSAQSQVSSEVSPVLGFINPTTVAETAQHAGKPRHDTGKSPRDASTGKTPRDIDAMLTPRAIEHTTAAAAARSKLQNEGPKPASVRQLMSSQQHETAPINQEIFAGAVAVPATSMPRLSAVRTVTPRTKVTAELPATRLPRSPAVDKTRGRDETSQATFVTPAPRNAAAAGGPSASALPVSPFSRLKAALQSQRRQFEQDEKPALAPRTVPALRTEAVCDRTKRENETESVHTACIQNPHFRGDAAAEGSEALHATTSLGAAAFEDGDDVLRGSVCLSSGLDASNPASDAKGETLLDARDIAPPNASYAWLVNGPSAPSSQSSQPQSQCCEPVLGSKPAGSTSPLPKPETSEEPTSLHSSSKANLSRRLRTEPSVREGASAPLLSRVSAGPSGDGNRSQSVLELREGAAELGSVPQSQSNGSYWRRGAPLQSSHKGTSQGGVGGGSSRGSSPGEFRSVSPPLPAPMKPSFVSRQFPTGGRDRDSQSLLAASASTSALATQHSSSRHEKLRSAPLPEHRGRDRAAEEQGDSDRRGSCDSEEQVQDKEAYAAYMQRMRELQRQKSALYKPDAMRRDGRVAGDPASFRRKPPGRVGRTETNADNKRLLAAAPSGPIRKARAWM